MPRAMTSIGSKLENWLLLIILNPYLSPRTIIQPIEPCIQSSAKIKVAPTITTSDALRRLNQSSTAIANAIAISSRLDSINSRFNSTFTPSFIEKVTAS